VSSPRSTGDRRDRGNPAFHVIAALALTFHIGIGGFATGLVLGFGAVEGGLIVIGLKGLAVTLYFAGIILGGVAWNGRHWAMVALPVLSLGSPFVVVLLGNEVASWGLPIGH